MIAAGMGFSAGRNPGGAMKVRAGGSGGRGALGTLRAACLRSAVAGAFVLTSPAPGLLAEDSAAVLRFRYDPQSGRCLDAAGREGYNAGSREIIATAQAECSDLSAQGLNLTYLRVTGANLRGANLAGVLFYLGSITDSDLTGANLSGTSGQMDYRRSRLRNASLSGADLSWGDLRDTDLQGADLRGARFNPHTQLPFDHDEARRRGMVFTPAQ
jgi:hypothetical protein